MQSPSGGSVCRFPGACYSAGTIYWTNSSNWDNFIFMHTLLCGYGIRSIGLSHYRNCFFYSLISNLFSILLHTFLILYPLVYHLEVCCLQVTKWTHEFLKLRIDLKIKREFTDSHNWKVWMYFGFRYNQVQELTYVIRNQSFYISLVCSP